MESITNHQRHVLFAMPLLLHISEIRGHCHGFWKSRPSLWRPFYGLLWALKGWKSRNIWYENTSIYLLEIAFPLIVHLEICFNIRHFELHGRKLEDPWSCRHTAIYHQVSFEDSRSIWIIIQRPKRLQSGMKSMDLGPRDRDSSSTEHPLVFYITYISACVANWTRYLHYMTERLEILVSIPLVRYNLRKDTDRPPRIERCPCRNFTPNMISTSQSAKTYKQYDES